MFRGLRVLRSTLPKAKPNALPKSNVARCLSTSPRAFSEPPPALYGEGAKAGAVPTDFQQATGLERLQLLGQMEGVDVFNTGPLIVSKLGTLEEPTLVPSYVRPINRV